MYELMSEPGLRVILVTAAAAQCMWSTKAVLDILLSIVYSDLHENFGLICIL